MLLVSKSGVFAQCNPMPKADFSVDDFCETDSAIFVNLSINADSYLWKFGDGQISTKKSPKHFYHGSGIVNNATLIAKASNGCADSLTKPYVMNANPSSDFSYIIDQKDVIFTPKQQGSRNYKWYFGNGDSFNTYKVSYTYPKPTKDTVCLIVINAAGCYSKTCKEVLVTLNLTQSLNTYRLNIYPNPGSGLFTLDIPEFYGDYQIEIIDPMGQIIYKQENIQTNYMDLTLPKGVYNVRVRSTTSSQSTLLVVN
jgi:PKD repeat protein